MLCRFRTTCVDIESRCFKIVYCGTCPFDAYVTISFTTDRTSGMSAVIEPSWDESGNARAQYCNPSFAAAVMKTKFTPCMVRNSRIPVPGREIKMFDKPNHFISRTASAMHLGAALPSVA